MTNVTRAWLEELQWRCEVTEMSAKMLSQQVAAAIRGELMSNDQVNYRDEDNRKQPPEMAAPELSEDRVYPGERRRYIFDGPVPQPAVRGMSANAALADLIILLDKARSQASQLRQMAPDIASEFGVMREAARVGIRAVIDRNTRSPLAYLKVAIQRVTMAPVTTPDADIYTALCELAAICQVVAESTYPHAAREAAESLLRESAMRKEMLAKHGGGVGVGGAMESEAGRAQRAARELEQRLVDQRQRQAHADERSSGPDGFR